MSAQYATLRAAAIGFLFPPRPVSLSLPPQEPLKVPAFLDCEGPPFDPLWGTFRRAAIRNARAGYPEDASLRNTAAVLIHRYEPVLLGGTRAWVVHLRSAASGDIYRLNPDQEGGTDAAACRLPGADGAAVGCDGPLSPLGDEEGVIGDAARQEDYVKFCLFGYVHALFIEHRHTSERDPRTAEFVRLAINSPDSGVTPMSSVCEARRGLLQVAEQLLGGETHETDFLESSSWPVTSLDIRLSLHTPSERRQQGGKECSILYNPVFSPPLYGAPLAIPPAIARPAASGTASGHIRIAALGLHVASTLEPVSALRSGAGTATPTSVAYFGHPCYGSPGDKSLRHACIFKCNMLGEPCMDDAVADVLKGMFNASSGLYEELAWSLHDALGALASFRDGTPALRQANLIVCSGPLVLCYLLDVLTPETPMVHPVCSQLLWGAPQGDTAGTMLLGYVRLAAKRDNRLFVACNAFAAAQCLYQTGVALHIVPRVALYLPPGLRWAAGKPGGHWREVLVLRARYWHRMPGQYFMDVLEAFLRTNEARYNLSLLMAASMGPDELPPAEISRYRSILLVPNDLTVFAFIEVYAMCVPTFVPTPEWLYRLHRTVPFGFLQPAATLPHLQDGDASEGFPFPPFWRAEGRGHPDDVTAVIHWQRLSELHSYPGVHQFASVPELLEKLVATDLGVASIAMAAYGAELRNHSAKAWRTALYRLIGNTVGVEADPEAIAIREDGVGAPAEDSANVSGGNYSAQQEFANHLSCRAVGFEPVWPKLLELLLANAAKGFPVDWALQSQAEALWHSVQQAGDDLLMKASALFHQVLLGDADPSLLAMADHCHYGIVAALFVLARHCLPAAILEHGVWRYSLLQEGEVEGGDELCGTVTGAVALSLLGDSLALDFMEDSEWPISALDIAALDLASRFPLDGKGFGFSRFSSALERATVEASVAWRPGVKLPSLALLEGRAWQIAVVGAHPSLSADIAEAATRALDNRANHRFFGLSCPGHDSASHHCSFRCEVLGQCEDDLVFSHILGQMLDWDTFQERLYDPHFVAMDLHKIVEADAYLSSAELLLCTGPFVLCAMLRSLVSAPMLVYLGLALTYLATAAGLKRLLAAALSFAKFPGFHQPADSVGDVTPLSTPRPGADELGRSSVLEEGGGEDGVEALTAAMMVVTDLIRAAQLHHTLGVWVPAVAPLAFYYQAASSVSPIHAASMSGSVSLSSVEGRRAIALRSELWRRAAFGPPLQGILRRLGPPTINFQDAYLAYSQISTYDAAVLVPWDNDVMSFYELYHAGMPMLIPSERLMTKWLPSVRWGSLEPDSLNIQRLGGVVSMAGAPWANQSSLADALVGGAYGWIGASDYYRYPHILHFMSVAGLLAALRTMDPPAVGGAMRQAGEGLRVGAIAFYRALLGGLLKAPRWEVVSDSGTCRSGFLAQADFREGGSRTCRQFCEETRECAIATFNGLCCMLYDAGCDLGDLRREGERAGYRAWRLRRPASVPRRA